MWSEFTTVEHTVVYRSRTQQRRPVLVSIVDSISACHAEDRGSIRRRGGFFFATAKRLAYARALPWKLPMKPMRRSRLTKWWIANCIWKVLLSRKCLQCVCKRLFYACLAWVFVAFSSLTSRVHQHVAFQTLRDIESFWEAIGPKLWKASFLPSLPFRAW